MKKVAFLMTILCLSLLVLVGCGYEQSSTVDVPIDKPITIIIERQIDSYEHENGGKKVTITDIATVNEIHELYFSLTFESTSAPMLFPRYIITFQNEDLETLTWCIDENNLISVMGMGNVMVTNNAYLYQNIKRLFALWE